MQQSNAWRVVVENAAVVETFSVRLGKFVNLGQAAARMHQDVIARLAVIRCRRGVAATLLSVSRYKMTMGML